MNRYLSVIVLLLTSQVSSAGVFKCTIGSKVVFQAHPCSQGVVEKVEIKKRDPEVDPYEAAKLQQWKEDRAYRLAMENEQKENARAAANAEAQDRIFREQSFAASQVLMEANENKGSQDELLQKITKKLNHIENQQMLNTIEQQEFQRQQQYNNFRNR